MTDTPHHSWADRKSGTNVAVVIVHRNQPERLALTVARFRDEPHVGSVTVVDNASTAGNRLSVDALEDEGVTIIDSPTNSGYGPGLNVGARHWLRHGSAEWVILSPHDALIEPGGVGRLLSLVQERDHPGIVCADVADQATPHVDHVLGALPGPATVYEGWEPAHYPHGTLIMASRACLADIGLFDERYFAYCDEADLGLRARAAGWEVGLARGVMVENPTTSTPAAVIDYLRLRNTILLLATHSGRLDATTRTLIGLANIVHARVRPSIRPPWFDARARLCGLRDAVRRRWGPPPDDGF